MKSATIIHERADLAVPRSRVRVAASYVTALLAFADPSQTRAESATRLLNLNIEELGAIKIDTVFAASKFSEKVTDAPSSVTIVTRDEITRFGYRTLSDIVRAVRGFDVVYDRTYSYTGARGFNSVDDYGSRTLLLIDGHRMNDPIYAIAAVGTEGLLDVSLIERVEFIRGPGSAIYGSNAFLAVINVVTRSGASVNGVEASADAGSFGTYSGRFTLGKKLANGLEYLVSGTTYASEGPARLFYKEFDAPETNHGIASHLNAERYWSMLGKVSYGDFTLQGGYVTRDKEVPTAWYGSAFGPPSDVIDSRGYLDLSYAHETAGGWSLSGRAYYDAYDYHGHIPYDSDTGIVVNNDSARANWRGAEAGVSRTFFNCFRFALGTEMRQGAKLGLRNYDERPFTPYLEVSSDQTVLGTYADGRWEITKALSLSGGLRWDHYDTFGNTVNPRLALIWKPREGTVLKLLYGQAFRAPNIYQLNFAALNQHANPALQPETIRTCEAVAEQYLGTHWRGTVSLFRNEISDLIDLTDDTPGFVHFANTGEVFVNGAEVEVEGKWDNGVLVRASYARQEAESAMTRREIVNSPTHMLKAHVSVPVFRDKIFTSLELLYASDRLTVPRTRAGDAWLLNATLFSRELLPGLEVSASVYNLLDQRYATPVSDVYAQESIGQDGRTFRLKVSYRF